MVATCTHEPSGDLGRSVYPTSFSRRFPATAVSGMRFRGFPIGHHMGTDAIDLFVRTTRHLGDGLQLGANFNWQERDRGQSLHETKREAAVDLWRNLEVQF